MSLAGDAAVVIWNDVTGTAHADFLAWHNREHIPERISIPGFRRGRRGRAVSAGPEFLTLYEVADFGVLTDGHYPSRLNSPSASTQRILPEFRNTARSLCRVEVSVGGGIGGYLCTVRLPEELRKGREVLSRFRAGASEILRHSTELLGVHLLARDLDSSRHEMAEKKLRAEPVAMPAAVLLVEGTAENAVATAAGELVGELERLALASSHEAVAGVYRHELCLTNEEFDTRELGPPAI